MNTEFISERTTEFGYVLKLERHSMGGLDPLEYETAYNPMDQYIGNPETAKMLCEDRGIAPVKASEKHNVCSIGFCDKEQKWYGWSHRAMFGFGIGSTVKRGDCAYIGATPEELIEDRGAFFADISEECAKQHMDECQILDDRSGIRILHTPVTMPMVKSMGDLESAIEGDDSVMEEITLWEDAVSVEKVGRGQWTAQTLEDAKEMAIDFAESVG